MRRILHSHGYSHLNRTAPTASLLYGEHIGHAFGGTVGCLCSLEVTFAPTGLCSTVPNPTMQSCRRSPPHFGNTSTAPTFECSDVGGGAHVSRNREQEGCYAERSKGGGGGRASVSLSRLLVGRGVWQSYLTGRVYSRTPPTGTAGFTQRCAPPIPPVLTQVSETLQTSLKYIPSPYPIEVKDVPETVIRPLYDATIIVNA